MSNASWRKVNDECPDIWEFGPRFGPSLADVVLLGSEYVAYEGELDANDDPIQIGTFKTLEEAQKVVEVTLKLDGLL